MENDDGRRKWWIRKSVKMRWMTKWYHHISKMIWVRIEIEEDYDGDTDNCNDDANNNSNDDDEYDDKDDNGDGFGSKNESRWDTDDGTLSPYTDGKWQWPMVMTDDGFVLSDRKNDDSL